MKQLRDYKKQFSFFLVALFLLAPFVFSDAQTKEELNTKIREKSADITRLEQEIAAFERELNSLSQEKNSLNSSIKTLDITRKKLAADIAITRDKIDQTNLKIQTLGKDINVKEGAIALNESAIGAEIRRTNELEQNSLLETILSPRSFSEVWDDIEDMATVSLRMRDAILELREIKGELEDRRDETVKAKNELLILNAKLADQKRIVDQNTAEKKKLLAETKNNEANYQKLLQDRLTKKLAFEKELRDYESALQYILDPAKLPSAGVLSWPLDYIYVTQFFGKTEAGKRLYASGTHNGVDFRAAMGTPIKAMADGVVAGVGDTDVQCAGVSFGRFALLKFNNGLAATYGHMSLVKVSPGQSVARGQIIGYSGNTGYSTGPHLHVSVYARDAVELKTLPSKSCPGRVLTQPISAVNAYLDPMYYLPPYRR
ncbi:hypothetical protein A3G06_00530 [Candidatus Nomurabacteria bacterium RIFCSPLOWO2_12_FULL_46_14]|uniref:M23ase beta-sheet core domain-containing protein n=1 Tax=Candidatus Nomurabacteria bacterium RIFCSPLOWO2_12_FULL_46_14 TaxID=1801797 RepID=A0A1F6YC74_9BACT|nr:MAG: hypothetical protein A3G06_00530 [Candidatus Nomurabacteria bacterium RIFCSPLOWO2_12_FULL_46_14]